MRDFKPFNPEKKSAQGTYRKDTVQRLAEVAQHREQFDGSVDSYSYGPEKRVGPNLGDKFKNTNNAFLDGLRRANMYGGGGSGGGTLGGREVRNTHDGESNTEQRYDMSRGIHINDLLFARRHIVNTNGVLTYGPYLGLFDNLEWRWHSDESVKATLVQWSEGNDNIQKVYADKVLEEAKNRRRENRRS